MQISGVDVVLAHRVICCDCTKAAGQSRADVADGL